MYQRIKLLGLAIAISLPFFAAIGDPANYERSLQNTLVSEGYDTYTNIVGDPGGPTKYGITIHDVRHYLKPNATANDVRALTLPEAKGIYRLHYWDAISGDALPAGLDYTVFDVAVNAGVGRAQAFLKACHYTPVQRSITRPVAPEMVPDGPKVIPPPLWKRFWQYIFPPARAATFDVFGEGVDIATVEAIKCVNAKRMTFQMGLGPSYDKFKRGWKNRIKSVNNISLNMAGVKQAKADIGIDLYAIPRIGVGKAMLMEDIR